MSQQPVARPVTTAQPAKRVYVRPTLTPQGSLTNLTLSSTAVVI